MITTFTTRYFEGDTKRIQLNLYKRPWAPGFRFRQVDNKIAARIDF